MLWLTLAGLASLVVGIHLMGKVFTAAIGTLAVTLIVVGGFAMLASLVLFILRVLGA